MKRIRRWQRIFILFLLSLSVFAPIFLLSNKLKSLSFEGRKQFNDLEDLYNIIHSNNRDSMRLRVVGQEAKEGVKEPNSEVYRDQNYSVVSDRNSDVESSMTGDQEMMSESEQRVNERSMTEEIEPDRENKDKLNERSDQQDHTVRPPNLSQSSRRRDSRSETRRRTYDNLNHMKDQVIRARAYLSFSIAARNTHLTKELRLHIKEVERVLGSAKRDSELSRSALQKKKVMESTLLKASREYPDCSDMVNKLRAMTHRAEDQVQSQRKQTTFLNELAGRTTPKGLHCLSMRLTTEYFTLQPEQQILPNQQNIFNPDFFHYAVFSDNILAAAVVVNSTVSNALEPERIAFHIVTDSLNFPAFSMWFLLNPPGKAIIQVLSVSDFHWFPAYESELEKQGSRDPRYISPLNHLRFHLPEIFPQLDKIVFLDHDVVVQKDLSGLWDVDMKGKENAAIETCQEGQLSFRRMDMLINFSDPLVGKKFDSNACTWAFGVNVFDLRQWRHHDLTSSYRRFLIRRNGRPFSKAGTLPLGWLTFYERTVALDKHWHLLGLGFDSQLKLGDIEQAAVIHYDGLMKPWLDIGIKEYKGYWNKYVSYDHPYLQQCNLHV